MQNFTPGQLASLKLKFLEQGEGSVPLEYLQLTNFLTSALYSTLQTYFLQASQASNFATATQGALADTALQPGSNISNTIGGVPADTLVSQTSSALALAQIAFGWGNHAVAGYLTSAPKLQVYQAVATGGAAEVFTLPQAPTAGSSVIVLVMGSGKHYTVTDPPPTANEFYWDGATTVKVDTALGDLVSIYFEA